LNSNRFAFCENVKSLKSIMANTTIIPVNPGDATIAEAERYYMPLATSSLRLT
jgi:hypothetical protein